MGEDAGTGEYTFPVMDRLKALMQDGQLVIGYSWAGDTIPYKDTSVLQEAYRTAAPDKQEAAYQDLKQAVTSGTWWMQYKGMVEGSIRSAVQAGRPVTAIGIQGGPICDVEQREMVGLVNLMKANLRALGRKPDIELDMNLPTFERFAEKYGL